jgi:hypothetical protein
VTTLPSFATHTVTVVRPSWADDHGASVRDWDNTTTHTVTGCSVQPVTGSEDEINRAISVTTVALLYAPAAADIADTDRIRFGGVTFEVEGSVRRFTTGVLDHLEVSLRFVSG